MIFNIYSHQYWSPSNIRNGRISTSCSIGNRNGALTLGENLIYNTQIFKGYTVSHAVL